MAKLEDSINVQALISAESNIDTTLSVLHVLSRSPCNSKISYIEQTPPNKHIQQQRHLFQPNVNTKLEYGLPNHQNRNEEMFKSHS